MLLVRLLQVGQLRCQIEGMELSRKEMASEYERQLNTLRAEVSAAFSLKLDRQQLTSRCLYSCTSAALSLQAVKNSDLCILTFAH